jgi:hypothetical protein
LKLLGQSVEWHGLREIDPGIVLGHSLEEVPESALDLIRIEHPVVVSVKSFQKIARALRQQAAANGAHAKRKQHEQNP